MEKSGIQYTPQSLAVPQDAFHSMSQAQQQYQPGLLSDNPVPPPAYSSLPNTQPQLPVMVQPTVIYVTHNVGPTSCNMRCPACDHNIVTRVEYETSSTAHLCALGLCLLGCVFGCCLIPYCTDSCMNVNHTCPTCGALIGTYRR